MLSCAAVPRGCLLPPGSLALGVLPASISEPQRSTEHLQALPFSLQKIRSSSSRFLSLPPKIHDIIFSHKVFCRLTSCWWGRRVQSEGTKVSLGWGCPLGRDAAAGEACLLTTRDGPAALSAPASMGAGYHSAGLHTEFGGT